MLRARTDQPTTTPLTAATFVRRIRSLMARGMVRLQAEDPARWRRLKRMDIEGQVDELLMTLIAGGFRDDGQGEPVPPSGLNQGADEPFLPGDPS